MSRHDEPGAEVDVRFGRAWRDHHRYVLDVAFRTLGNLAAAEDVVQEAYARLLRVDIEEIDDVRGWLVVVTGRLCLDKLRADKRRPTVPGDLDDDRPSPPSRLTAPSPDPADRITLDDNVRNALHLVLERLSPAERTAFVLHDVFRFSFDEVASIVGRSPAACRQLASRARRNMQSEVTSARFTVESAEERQVTERFIAACATGDVDSLLTVLDPDVAGEADLGPDMPRPPVIVGREDVAANLLRFFGPETGATMVSLPADEDGPVVAAFVDHKVAVTVSLTIRDGLIHHMHAVVDPTAYRARG